MKCIVCLTREVNPAIGSGTDVPSGKSFCSHVCHGLYHRWDLQYLPPERLKALADSYHEYIEYIKNFPLFDPRD